MHLCWGNYEGPDVPLADVIDVAVPGRARLPSRPPTRATRREWRLFETGQLPGEKILIPGVIESKSNFIEHPSSSRAVGCAGSWVEKT